MREKGQGIFTLSDLFCDCLRARKVPHPLTLRANYASLENRVFRSKCLFAFETPNSRTFISALNSLNQLLRRFITTFANSNVPLRLLYFYRLDFDTIIACVSVWKFLSGSLTFFSTMYRGQLKPETHFAKLDCSKFQDLFFSKYSFILLDLH